MAKLINGHIHRPSDGLLLHLIYLNFLVQSTVNVGVFARGTSALYLLLYMTKCSENEILRSLYMVLMTQ
jgi:hypothetical protein